MNLPKVDVSRFRIRGIDCRVSHAADSDAIQFAYALQVDDVDAGTTTMVQGKQFLDRRLKPDAFAHLVRSGLLDAIAHELDECLFIDGKRTRDPHPELKRPREVWETATACDCPTTRRDLKTVGERANAGLVHVCDRAFATLGEVCGIPDPYRSFKVPVFPEPSVTFEASREGTYSTIDVIAGKVH